MICNFPLEKTKTTHNKEPKNFFNKKDFSFFINTKIIPESLPSKLLCSKEISSLSMIAKKAVKSLKTAQENRLSNCLITAAKTIFHFTVIAFLSFCVFTAAITPISSWIFMPNILLIEALIAVGSISGLFSIKNYLLMNSLANDDEKPVIPLFTELEPFHTFIAIICPIPLLAAPIFPLLEIAHEIPLLEEKVNRTKEAYRSYIQEHSAFLEKISKTDFRQKLERLSQDLQKQITHLQTLKNNPISDEFDTKVDKLLQLLSSYLAHSEECLSKYQSLEENYISCL